ncbi:AfsR/SARP family transcriptional regulator [Streptomyces sp. NPDC055078]
MVLGPLQLAGGNGPTTISAPRLQQLTALLVMARSRTLPLTAIRAELWPTGPPPTAGTTIRTYVHELRKLLPGDTGRSLTTDPTGYRLTVGLDDVDAFVFERLAESARALLRGRPAPQHAPTPPHAPTPYQVGHAADLLGEALALWRGRPFAGLPTGPRLELHLAALEAAWLRAAHLRIHTDLLLGRHRDLIGELKTLVSEYPLDERFLAQLMIALHRCGRRGEALTAYRGYQQTLRGELGADPAPPLRRLRNSIHAARDADPVPAHWTIPR